MSVSKESKGTFDVKKSERRGRRWGTSLVAQWLRLCTSNAWGAGSIPGGGTKILHDTQRGIKKKEKEKRRGRKKQQME